MSRIKACIYAGDAGDEYCKTCDGKTITVNGKSVSAQQCPGYSTKEEEEDELPFTDTPKEEKVEETNTDTSESIGFASNSDDNTSDDKNIESEEKSVEMDENAVKTESEFATTTEICFSSGASVEVNGLWYKFVCEERRVLKEGANISEEREKLWATVNNEVDEQLEEVVSFRKSN